MFFNAGSFNPSLVDEDSLDRVREFKEVNLG